MLFALPAVCPTVCARRADIPVHGRDQTGKAIQIFDSNGQQRVNR